MLSSCYSRCFGVLEKNVVLYLQLFLKGDEISKFNSDNKTFFEGSTNNTEDELLNGNSNSTRRRKSLLLPDIERCSIFMSESSKVMQQIPEILNEISELLKICDSRLSVEHDKHTLEATIAHYEAVAAHILHAASTLCHNIEKVGSCDQETAERMQYLKRDADYIESAKRLYEYLRETIIHYCKYIKIAASHLTTLRSKATTSRPHCETSVRHLIEL